MIKPSSSHSYFRQGAAVTDVLRFDRIAGAETTQSETPPACP
jgi:hypothetical protein